MTETESRIPIVCVDDNPHLVDALRLRLSRTPHFEWRGSLDSADDLLDTIRREHPSIVILDLDMPGKDPIESIADAARVCPDCRIVVFSSHVRRDLIRRALDAGAWGYASKHDGEGELIEVLEQVASGSFALSSSVRAVSA